MPIKTPICDFGQKAEDFNLKSTDNKMISLNDIKGKNGTLIMFICNHCPYVKAVTKDIVEDCKKLKDIGINSKVIYSGSIERILPKKNFKKKKFYKLISVGRLTKQKNYKLLINSIKLLKSKNFKLFIYGNGAQKDKLKKIILKNKLEKRIYLMSQVENKDKIYKNADLLVHTALFEGLPNCIVEAINFGVPIIAYNGAGGISEILSNGKYGDIVKKHDEYEISKKIENFFKNPTILQKKIVKSKSSIYKFVDFKTAISLENEILKI